jgi:hypothetical protein
VQADEIKAQIRNGYFWDEFSPIQHTPMIPFHTAFALHEAGLIWQPALHDFFAIPHSELDDRVFVLTDMVAELTVLKGWPAITFNGAVEWSLDYILQMDAVWLPREDQLRAAVAALTPFELCPSPAGYVCTIPHEGGSKQFVAAEAEDVYAAVWLFLQR